MTIHRLVCRSRPTAVTRSAAYGTGGTPVPQRGHGDRTLSSHHRCRHGCRIPRLGRPRSSCLTGPVASTGRRGSVRRPAGGIRPHPRCAATAGRAETYYARRARLGSVDAAADQAGRLAPIRKDAIGHALALGVPPSGRAEHELAAVMDELADPGPCPAVGPARCRWCGSRSLEAFLPHLAGVVVEFVQQSTAQIVLHAHGRAAGQRVLTVRGRRARFSDGMSGVWRTLR